MSNSLQVIETEGIQPIGMITPAGSIDQAVEQFHIYQQLKEKIGTPEDFQEIRGRDGVVKYHPKKSLVRKIQRFFNVSCEILQDEPFRNSDGEVVAWLAKVRAIHLGTGAFQDADGSCSFDEKTDRYGNPIKSQQTIHNIRAHAMTRAKNRAILDLVGFGEVSAEEIPKGSYEPTETNQSTRFLTDRQRRALFKISHDKGLSDDEIREVVIQKTNKESTKELERKEASQLIDYVKNTPLEKIRESLAPDQLEAAKIEDASFEELDEVVTSE